MNPTYQNIENELKQKRIKPEAFIDQFEKFFDEVAHTYKVSTREWRQQGKNRRAYFRPFKKLNKSMDFSKITKKIAAYAAASQRAIAKGKIPPDFPNLDGMLKELEGRNDFILNFDTNPDGFKKILDEYHINELRNQLTGGALSGWLTSRLFGVVTKLVILVLAVIAAVYIDEPLTTTFKPIGDTKAIIVTTVILSLTVDTAIDAIKDWLLWQRVKTCFYKYKKVRDIINVD